MQCVKRTKWLYLWDKLHNIERTVENLGKALELIEVIDAPGEPTLDESILIRLGEETDPEILPQLVNTFTTHIASRLPILLKAVEDSAWTDVADEAHAIKSSAATFGVMRLNGLAASLEQAGKDKDAAKVIAEAPELQAEVTAATEALNGFLDQQGSAKE